MEHWDNFLAFEFAPQVLMLVGGLLILFGFLKILGSSLKIMFWVLLVAVGAFSFNFGWDRTETGSEVSLSGEIRDLLGPGKDLTMDAMTSMCEKIGIATGETFGD